jgi:tRNA-Thr(GGU) m(6)t(6)A37 methyltransferase TsaA
MMNWVSWGELMTEGWLSDIKLKPIGFVRHGYSDDFVRNSLMGVDAVIEVLPEYVDGLKGLEGFSHIIVVAYMHKAGEEHKGNLLVKPRGLARRLGISLDALPTVGVFATNSPHRPNPIAVTIAKLVRIEGDKLFVENIDLFNGTPVLDIKPYTRDRCIEDARMPKWLEDLVNRTSRR